jgi:IS30 family transposase
MNQEARPLDAEAFGMKVAGMSVTEIARRLNLSWGTVDRAWRREAARRRAERQEAS